MNALVHDLRLRKALRRAPAHLLLGPRPDAVTFVLVAVALVASGLPMLRVIRLDPLAVLRAE